MEEHRSAKTPEHKVVDIDAELKKAIEANPRLRDWFKTSDEAEAVIKQDEEALKSSFPTPPVYSTTPR